MKEFKRLRMGDHIFDTKLFGQVRLNKMESCHYHRSDGVAVHANDVIRMDTLKDGRLYTAEFNQLDVPDLASLRDILQKLDRLVELRDKDF